MKLVLILALAIAFASLSLVATPVASAKCYPIDGPDCVLWCPDSPRSTQSCRLFPNGPPLGPC